MPNRAGRLRSMFAGAPAVLLMIPIALSGCIDLGPAPEELYVVLERSTIDNDELGRVLAFNTETNDMVATIPVGYDPVTMKVSRDYAFVLNDGSDSVSVIDLHALADDPVHAHVAELAIGGDDQEDLAVFPNGEFLMVATDEGYPNGTLEIWSAHPPFNKMSEVEVALRFITNPGNPRKIAVNSYDARAYVTIEGLFSDDVATIDIRDPNNPLNLGETNIGALQLHSPRAIEVSPYGDSIVMVNNSIKLFSFEQLDSIGEGGFDLEPWVIRQEGGGFFGMMVGECNIQFSHDGQYAFITTEGMLDDYGWDIGGGVVILDVWNQEVLHTMIDTRLKEAFEELSDRFIENAIEVDSLLQWLLVELAVDPFLTLEMISARDVQLSPIDDVLLISWSLMGNFGFVTAFDASYPVDGMSPVGFTAVGRDPESIAYSANGRHFYTANDLSLDFSVRAPGLIPLGQYRYLGVEDIGTTAVTGAVGLQESYLVDLGE